MRRTVYEMIYTRFQKMDIIDESNKNLFRMVERIGNDIMIILHKTNNTLKMIDLWRF